MLRPVLSARARRRGCPSNSSTAGISRRRLAESFCILAAGSAEGLIAKLFKHNAIRPRNQRDFPLRQSGNRQSGRLARKPLGWNLTSFTFAMATIDEELGQ